MGVPQPKPMYGFSPNFQGMFIPRGSRTDFGGYLATTVAMATFEHFGVLTFVGVPQPKPMHRFSPNYQDILTETGSTAE